MQCPLTGISFGQRPPDNASTPSLPPLWRLGFRPFFLGGAFFAVVAIGLWIVAYMGKLPDWTPAGDWLDWHRHEMSFGFAAAIVAGFLMTAVQNWTGIPGVRGWPLAALVGLWLAARLCWLLDMPWWVIALPELSWLPLLAILIARSLRRTRQIHNYPILATLALLTLADALSLAGLATGNADWLRNGSMSAIWLIVALMTMIGGRVIPFFTQRALNIPARPAPTKYQLALDYALMAAAVLLAALSAGGLAMMTPTLLFAPLFAALAIGHAIRLWQWSHRGVWGITLLWPLHLSYLWMAVACAGLALFHVGLPLFFSFSLHALTVGAMGGLILAMVARVSLAHTGRSLEAPRPMAYAFILFHIGAAARVFFTPWLPSSGLIIAALCWMLAFGFFVLCHGPMLCLPRVDGEEG
ncbi:MAG: NnrS family protein [Betaproteobacteria bacterium]|nr:NnrS family protein [Betaproteobacteria bacterium]